MKKTLLFLFLAFMLLVLPSCSSTCEKYGVHDVVYHSLGDHHWQECTRDGCEYKTEKVAHTGGTATCQAKARCEVCNTPYGKIGSHDMKHTSLGENGHVYGCSFPQCESYRLSEEAHRGGTATCTEQARCEDCGGAYGALLEHTYEGEENGGACIYCHTTYLEETVEFHLSEDGRSYVLFAAQNYKQESIVIPAEYEGLAVTQIGEWSFANNKYVKSVYLPNTIKIIGEGAFDTSALQSIVCPDSLEVIGGEAFCGSQLETINLHTGIREIGGDAFVRTNIKSIVFPWSVEILEKNLFRGCNQLEQVIVQDGIRYIGTWAFADCPRLKTVVFPNTLEGTGGELFKESPAIEYNTYGGLRYIGTATNPFFAVVGSTGATNAVIHPDTELCTIKALLDCEEIVSLEIGAKVRTIEEWALIGMDALESITVDPQNSNYYVINNLLVDARTNTLIAGCKTSVIPDDGRFAEIDLGLFSGIQTMTEIWIPEGVKTIHIACGGMNSLEKIIIGPDVEHIIVHGNNDGCFETNSACFGVYYCFTEEEWKNVNVEYTFNRKAFMRPTDCYGDHATHYFYSETPPQGEGNYWHYVDGVPTPW